MQSTPYVEVYIKKNNNKKTLTSKTKMPKTLNTWSEDILKKKLRVLRNFLVLRRIHIIYFSKMS